MIEEAGNMKKANCMSVQEADVPFMWVISVDVPRDVWMYISICHVITFLAVEREEDIEWVVLSERDGVCVVEEDMIGTALYNVEVSHVSIFYETASHLRHADLRSSSFFFNDDSLLSS